jgi:GAF domain-containing protein
MDYELLEAQIRELLSGERDELANMANFAAFVYHELPDVNWAGFYFADGTGELVLGPFNGRPACTRLAAGRGVCGASFTSGNTTVVDDVSSFADHIVCDSASVSEIVVPLHDQSGAVYGVLDIDSPRRARFSSEDAKGIERLVNALTERVPSRPAFLAHLVR